MKAAAPLPTRDELRRLLLDNVPVCERTEPALRGAVTAAVAHPGGLLRPQLAWETARAVGGDEAGAQRLACALEYFHTASLLLDDLPCMDDATERRGRPCAHRIHGEATAILAALALINRAHVLAATALADLPSERRLAGHVCLDACLGAAGLLEGQARDLRYGETPGGAAAVTRIARQKTGALFQLAVLLPALTGSVPAVEWAALGRLCLYWGLAYQAADDLVDVLGSAAGSGKTPERDRARRRPNLALALGTDGARRRLARQVRLGRETIARLTALNPRWAYLLRYQEHLTRLAAPLAQAA